MYFEDYSKTGFVYHIASINDLKKIMEQGISYDDKATYTTHYYEFHQFIDSLKPSHIPPWVKRKKSIFGTMNYKENPNFHSHTVVMALKVNPERCWVANENKANQLYEPFILKEINMFQKAENYIHTKGIELIQEYWETSLSFQENITKRMDLKEGYDAEVLILHPIPPEEIQLLYIVSDHRLLTLEEWKSIFCIS